MEINSDNVIIELKNRNEKALDYLYESYIGLAYKIALNNLEEIGSREDIEECVSDIFVGVWNNIEKYYGEVSSFKPWFSEVCKYKSIDYKRKLKSKTVNIELDENEIVGQLSLEDKLLIEEDIDALRGIIDSMSEVDREIFIKRYILNEKVDDISSKRIKKLINKKIRINKQKYKKVKTIAIAVFIAINIILISVGGTNVYANIGKSIMSSIARLRGDTSEYNKYNSRIDESVTDQGITFVINEIVSDYNSLDMSYSIISDGSLKDKVKDPSDISPLATINGQNFSGSSRDGNWVSENRYDGCDFIVDSKGIIPKDDFYLDVLMKNIGDLEGNWDIRVKVNSDKIKKEVKEYNVNKNVKVSGNETLNIKKIITSPLSIGIKARGVYGKYNYILLDDKGNQLDWRGTLSADGNVTMDYSGLPSMDTKSLTFIPFRFNEKYKPNFDVYSLDNLPVKVEQGDSGSVTVNKAEWVEKDKLKISYEVDSKYPITMSYAPILLDSNDEEIVSDNLSNHQVSRDNQKNFQKVFSGLYKYKTYKLGFHRMYEHYLIEEDKKFTIELKNR